MGKRQVRISCNSNKEHIVEDEIMEWEEYINEIELIEKQNNVEHDLYCVIAPLLKSIKNFKEYSIRDVDNRKRTNTTKNERTFWGIKGFPDFAILDRTYEASSKNDKDKVYGVVEAKFIGKPMLSKPGDKLQLIGHLLSFGKVIYTNAYEWRIYENGWKVSKEIIFDKENDSYEARSDSVDDKEKWKEINLWLKSFSLDELTYTSFVLKDASGWNKSQWDALLNSLEKLNMN